jgi:hypothetical protein
VERSWSLLSVLECLVCVKVKIVSFSLSGMCLGQNCQFQHVWNVSWSKLSVSACLKWNVSWSLLLVSARLECVVVKIVSFSMSGMLLGHNSQFQHVWYVSSFLACLEYVFFKMVSFSMSEMCCGQNCQFQHD